MKQLIALCAFTVVVTPGVRDAEIAAAVKSRVDAKKSAGMVVATIEPDGSSSFAAYGDPGPDARPLDADSVFEIGSITKVFTATLLADMADRGEVTLDDPVALYVPAGVRIPERNGRKITLLDLATQSSALPRLPGNMHARDPKNPYADYTTDDLFAFLSGYELTRDVGAQYEYSNLGVGLLGQALSRKAGKSYEALVDERILKPLKMEHSGITLTPWMREHLARGHNAQLQIVPNWDLPALAGAGALRSTMNDMLKFARANLDASAGRLSRVMQTTHERRRAAGSPDMSIGLAWHIRHADGRDIVWHNGGTGGYRTWLGFDKGRRVAAIVLTNSSLSNDDLGFALVK